jgi:hypothetical protein
MLHLRYSICASFSLYSTRAIFPPSYVYVKESFCFFSGLWCFENLDSQKLLQSKSLLLIFQVLIWKAEYSFIVVVRFSIALPNCCASILTELLCPIYLDPFLNPCVNFHFPCCLSRPSSYHNASGAAGLGGAGGEFPLVLPALSSWWSAAVGGIQEGRNGDSLERGWCRKGRPRQRGRNRLRVWHCSLMGG